MREVKAPGGSCIREEQRAATDPWVVGAAVGLPTPRAKDPKIAILLGFWVIIPI